MAHAGHTIADKRVITWGAPRGGQLMSTASTVAIFGGTFDPPQHAHVMLPRLVARQLGCDRLVYVPTRANPLKDHFPTLAHHRLAMLQLALRDVPEAEICTFELDRPAPSYTVDTLEALAAAAPAGTRFRLLMGSDSALGFDRWRNPERILELATPAVMLRPPMTRERFIEAMTARAGAATARRWADWVVDIPQRPESATAVREGLAAGRSVDDLVDPAVLAYVREHGLYRTVPTAPAD